MIKVSACRYHDISCGHRVVGHPKCGNLHGHNYRIHFELEAENRGDMVLDFGVIKTIFCEWLESNWDHRFLVWDNDKEMTRIINSVGEIEIIHESIYIVPFNPTAENMANYLISHACPYLLSMNNIDGVTVTRVTVEETRKCSASAELEPSETVKYKA